MEAIIVCNGGDMGCDQEGARKGGVWGPGDILFLILDDGYLAPCSKIICQAIQIFKL